MGIEGKRSFFFNLKQIILLLILLGNSATFFEKILALISGQAAVEIALLFANFYFLAIFLRKNPDSNFDSYLVEHRARQSLVSSPLQG